MNATTEERIKASVEALRAVLQEEGADISFVRYEPENATAVIAMEGALKGHPMAMMTFRGAIERKILAEVPELKRIEPL